MTLTAVIGGKAAPGVTTLSLAMAWAADRPVVVIDADPFGGDVVPGMLPGRADNSGGLLPWLVATRRAGALQAAAQLPSFGVAVSEQVPLTVVAGIQSPSQAGTLTSSWERLATACEHVEGADVVVDLGRAHDETGWSMLSGADQVVLVVQPTARSVHGAGWVLAQLRARLGDLNRVRLVVNNSGPYTAEEVADALEFESAVRVPADRKAAAMLTEGALFVERSLLRSRLIRACNGLVAQRQAVPA